MLAYRTIPIGLIVYALIAPVARAADDRIDYLRAIKPILQHRCYSCHGGLQQKSKLRVDTVELMKKGGSSGPIVVPGSSAKSLIIEHITGSGGASRMPPASEGEGLKPNEIANIKAWIDQGASGPADEKPEADPKEHWAFKKPVKAALPESSYANPVDRFLDAQRRARNLKAQGPADPRVLLRRVYIDLIGLPPTLAEQEAFVKEYAANPQAAYAAAVDRLLNSRQYGERWGRHWLDIWRYSDWWGLGAEVRNSQKHIWHWRDWVIESLNADKGYDQMIREMLAADELYPTDADKLRGSGYLARQYFKFNRNSWLEETVEHTSKAFLGLTMNCTKCHDHKYDPFTQQDFYRLRAFFEPYQVRTDMTAGETDFEKNGIPRAFDCNLEAPTYLFVRGDEKNPKKDKSIAPGVPDILMLGKLEIASIALPLEAHIPGLRKETVESHLRMAEQKIATAREALAQARKVVAEIEKKALPVAKKEEASPPPKSSAKLLVRDDFSKPNPDLWETKAGDWKFENGRLRQDRDGAERGILRLKAKPPMDFESRLKFTPYGGKMWKSVGLTFDVTDANDVLVYLSAVASGPKLQIAYKQGADYVYPPGAAQPRSVNLGEAQDVTIRVRGQLVNVSVNGQHALAYKLPIPRKEGAIELITFDAKAVFEAFELSPLPADAKLQETSAVAAKESLAAMTVEQARLAVVAAEKTLALAELQPNLIKARIAADRARFQQPPAADAKELARAAARLEKQTAVAAAEESLARSEVEVAARKPDAAKKLAAAKDVVTKAKKELESPGETYTSLRGALKTLENNLETEASRSKPFPATSTGRRTALAKWMTDVNNPLTARVAVNHIWARHFGKPLVATVFDFGRKGAAPTHPELLDWLAVELMDKNWSMKHLHKLIVTSAAYQMSSSSANAVSTNLSADPENKYLWRMNPLRMEAQVIRDGLLHLSGELDLTIGGPTIPANAETNRRSLYFFHSHNDYNRFLANFDDANVLECYRRAESIVPQQALTLENSKLAMAAAEKIAKRITAKDDAEFVKAAFATVLSSTPTSDEQRECELALNTLREIAGREKMADGVLRSRINLIHALMNHNDFVTVR